MCRSTPLDGIASLFGREGNSAAQACDMTDEAGGGRGVPVEQVGG